MTPACPIATHALGQMPLQVELVDADGTCIQRKSQYIDEDTDGL